MNKVNKFLLVTALAGMVFASCQKETSVAPVQNDGQREIALTAFSKGLTKSVLGSGNSFDGSGRTIVVAGAMKTEGKWVDFLEPKDFTESEESKWVATPKVYYPLGGADGDFKFLAYSETAIPAGSTRKPVSARWYGSSEVEINVDEKCDTNDVVYAGFVGKKQGAAQAVFKHSQALVTVLVKTNRDTIKINKIGFEDVKTSGTLSLKRALKNDNTENDLVTVNWLFNSGCTCHFAEMGDYNIAGMDTTGTNAWKITAAAEVFFKEYEKDDSKKIEGTSEYRDCGLGTWFSKKGCYFSRLFPAQELETKTIVINYTLGKYTADARLTFENPSSGNPSIYTWEAGTHYVYEISVKPAEIVLDPSVENAWELKTITGVYGDGSYDVDEPAFAFTSGGDGNETSQGGNTTGWY